MGIHYSKPDDTLPSALEDWDTMPSTETRMAPSPEDITRWEKIYNERFTRRFVFSMTSVSPLYNCCDRKPRADTSMPWEQRLNTDICWNRCNPRYIGETPEPLTADLAKRTRYELRMIYRGYIICSWLRPWLKCVWSPRFKAIPRVPYLKGEIHFPHANEIKNGYILPSRIRAYILGQSEELPPTEDPFLVEELELKAMRLRLDHPSQVPYEDELLQGPWLNHTTAVYFEPIFENYKPNDSLVEYTGRGLFEAWEEVNSARGEQPNLQQYRYIANPVMLLGESEPRPVSDVIATHKRICDAVADAQDKPVSPKDPYSWVEHGAEMGVLYPSVIIVVDDPRGFRPRSNEDETSVEEKARDTIFNKVSVLLVRTGNEDHLSEPIDFSDLSSATLPLGRDEELDDNQQVVRVRLNTAVRFIMDLERREQNRCPRLTAMKNILDNDTFQEADTFASDSLEMAERNGSIDRNYNTWEAVRRARAYLDGEPFYTDPRMASVDTAKLSLRTWSR